LEAGEVENAVVDDLFARLPAGGHELVLFDINRYSGIEPLLSPGAVLPRLLGDGVRHFAVTLVTNTRADTHAVSAPAQAADPLELGHLRCHLGLELLVPVGELGGLQLDGVVVPLHADE